MTSYLTIEGRAQAEIEEKKSRFIAQLCHVETEEEALSFLEEIRTHHRMARHNVYPSWNWINTTHATLRRWRTTENCRVTYP